MKNLMVKIGKIVWGHKFMASILMLALGGAVFFGYKGSLKEKTSGEIQTVSAKRGDISVSVTGTGQVHAQSRVDIKGIAAGDGVEVVQVVVQDGQEVNKGDLIAVLDTTEPMKQVRDAKLNLQGAEISFKQTQRQYDSKTVDDKWQRQTKEISVQKSRNSYSEALEKLEDYSIRAPFDGIVTDLAVEAGDSVSQSDIIASVISKELYAQISLNEVDAIKVKEGNEVALTFDALSTTKVSGKISKIDTIGEVSQNVVSYKAKIEFQQGEQVLKPGMSVNAEIFVESRKSVLFVPDSTIKTQTDGSSYVETILSKGGGQNAGAEVEIGKQTVKVGLSDDLNTEIMEGLREGDIVILKMGSSADAGNSNSSTGGGLNFFGVGGGGGSGMRMR